MEQQLPSQQADQEPAEIVTLALWPSPNTALTGIALLVEPSLTMALGSVPMALKETCELVFPQLQPAMLVLPTSASTSDALPNFSTNEVGIHHLRAAEFSLDTAFSRLISIDYAVLNGYTHSPQEKLTALLAVLGMSGQQPLRSVGYFNKPTRQFTTAGSSMEPAEVAALRAGAGLLGFVLRRMQGLVISSLVRYAPPEAGMHIGRETLHALSILPPPNTNSATTLSIEHMFLRAIVTMPGRRLLKAWMLRPSCKLEVLQERLDAVECLYADPSLLATLRKAMRPIKDGPALIGRIIALRGTSQDWLGLLTTIDGLAHVAALPGVPLLDRVAGTPAVSATAELATLLREVLDITETRRQNRPVLRAGVSADLDALRAMFNALDGFLDSEADAAFALLQSEARDLAQGMNQFFVTWTANLGFHISTILPQGFRVEDGVPDALGRPVFSDGAYTHFKNSRMDTLDSEVGDLHRQITDVQAALVLRLVDAIKTRAEAIITLAGLVAQLDVLAAFAQVSMTNKWVRPLVFSHTPFVCDLETMVHPLIDQCVPNSIHTSNSTARVHIVTGANQGGKSVLLKAVGIVVYLSQLGCFVPCSSARLSIADAMYTKMRTMESVQQGVSAFAADCTSLARMLNDASPQSLLLIDEFGVGTDSADGTALFAAVVRHYSRTSPQSPLVWMTTHFTDAIAKHAQLLSSATRPCDAQEQHLQTNSSTDAQHSNNLNLNETRWIEEEEVEEADSFAHVTGNGPTKQGAQSCLNESLHGSDHATVTLTATSPTHEAKVYTMKTLVDKSREGNQRIAFLYELVEGLKLGSFGIEVAQAVGLPQHIIDMAKSLSLDE